MKIIHYMLGLRNADGGVVRAVIDICEALARSGHEVIAMTVDASDAPPTWDGSAGWPRLMTLKASAALSMLLSGESKRQARDAFNAADVVHLHVPWDPICAQLGAMARRMSRPYIVTIHGMIDDWTMGQKSAKKSVYLALAGRRLLERAAAVQCSAAIEAEQSIKWFPRGRTAVVPLLFDLAPFEHLPGPAEARAAFPSVFADPAREVRGTPRALCVGRLHPIKRLGMVLDAIAEASPGSPSSRCHIVLAGPDEDGHEAHLRARVSALGLADRVHFLGLVSGSNKLSLYQAVDAVIHPSAHESFGYVTVEALACGTPLVTTKAVNIWPELESSGGALIVEQTPQALAGGLDQVLGDAALRAEMGGRGRRFVFQHFEPDHVVRQYEDMYRQAIQMK